MATGLQPAGEDVARLAPRDIVRVAGRTWSFTVPGEPRGKGRPRFFTRGKHVGTFTDAKTAAYENLIKLEAERAGVPLIEGPVLLKVTAFLGVPKSASKKKRADMLADAARPERKPDIDNVIKAVMDGLNGVAFADDKQVVGLTISKFWNSTPYLVVEVRPLR